jgi:signal transduction histidine kinase
VEAAARDTKLEICVEDDGVGFDAARARPGVGLANLRERLATLYGGAAGLTIEDARPGTRVRLWLPLPPEERERAESSRCPLR